MAKAKSKDKFKPSEAVYIRWEDAWGGPSGWKTRDDLPEPEGVPIETIGFVVSDNAKGLLVAVSVDKQEPNKFTETFFVPRENIRFMKKVKL